MDNTEQDKRGEFVLVSIIETWVLCTANQKLLLMDIAAAQLVQELMSEEGLPYQPITKDSPQIVAHYSDLDLEVLIERKLLKRSQSKGIVFAHRTIFEFVQERIAIQEQDESS